MPDGEVNRFTFRFLINSVLTAYIITRWHLVDVFFRGYGHWCVDLDKKIVEQEAGFSGLMGRIFTDDLSDVYFACGVFRLIEEDEIAYRHLKSLENLGIEFLLPSKHPDCEFSRLASKGRITPSSLIPFNIDDVYFRLEKDQPELVTFAIAEPYKAANVEGVAETEHETIAILPPYLNPKHSMFSEELSIAIRAWTEVLECKPLRQKQGSRKKLIKSWLDIHYPSLSSQAKERITILINPDKTGGAPPSS